MASQEPAPGKGDREFWSMVRVGDFISLGSWEGPAAAATGGDFRVRDVRRIHITDTEGGAPLADYSIHELDTPDGSLLWFVLVSSGEDFGLRAYRAAPGFTPGTRDQLIDAGRTWLFLPPPDPEDFISSSLEYAPWPDLPEIEETRGGAPVKRVFGPFGFGKPVFGTYRRGAEDVPVILVESGCEEPEAPFPLLLTLEERWIRPDGVQPEEGGFVTAMIGRKLEPLDLDIFQR